MRGHHKKYCIKNPISGSVLCRTGEGDIFPMTRERIETTGAEILTFFSRAKAQQERDALCHKGGMISDGFVVWEYEEPIYTEHAGSPVVGASRNDDGSYKI